MSRYIEADSVRDEILYGEAYVSAELEVYIKKVFDEAPDADVAPVVHGKWKETEPLMCGTYGNAWWLFECSNCGRTYFTTHKYCPNCGAKMGLED